jgi:hypothetical protein
MGKKKTRMKQFQEYFKENFNLTVTALGEDFAIVEERKHVVHLCGTHFNDGKCDAEFIRGEDKCKACGAEIPGKFKMLDKMYAMETA